MCLFRVQHEFRDLHVHTADDLRRLLSPDDTTFEDLSDDMDVLEQFRNNDAAGGELVDDVVVVVAALWLNTEAK